MRIRAIRKFFVPWKATFAVAAPIRESSAPSGWRKEKSRPEFSVEPERYELLAGPAYHFTPDRRDFFKLLGAGLLVVLTLDAQESARGGRGRRGWEALPTELGAWLHVGEDGTITVYTGKTEVVPSSPT